MPVHRRTLHTSPPQIAEGLAAQGDLAHSHAENDESGTEHSSSTGRLAYFQYVLAETARLAETEAERLVMAGHPVDDIAQGLTDHGLDDVTAERLRAAWPLIPVAEQRVRWMRTNAATYLPLLHAVATYVAARWAGVLSEQRAQAEQTARSLVDYLRDTNTTDLDQVDDYALMLYAPHRLAWLSYLSPQLGVDDEAVQGVADLIGSVHRYYADAEDVAEQIGVSPPQPVFPADPLAALRETVQNPPEGDAALHTAHPVY